MPQRCTHCNCEYDTGSPQCTACGRPAPAGGTYPNVDLADAERGQLNARYEQVMQQAQLAGLEDVVNTFQNEILTRANLVTACGLEKISHLAERPGNVFPVYANLVAARIRFPGDDTNNTDRLVAEEATFPGFSRFISYAALSFDERGLSNYGNYFLFWRLDRIEHRTSLLEGNCLTFRRKNGIPLDSQDLPPGTRATWPERHKLAAVKCAGQLSADSKPEDYADILLISATNSNDDDFIEAHIWGPLTSQSLAKVLRIAPDPDPIPFDVEDRIFFLAMYQRMVKNLGGYGITYEVLA